MLGPINTLILTHRYKYLIHKLSIARATYRQLDGKQKFKAPHDSKVLSTEEHEKTLATDTCSYRIEPRNCLKAAHAD